MEYQLVYTDGTEQTQEFDSIWDALKAAIGLLEESECQIEGIGFGGQRYILSGAVIRCIRIYLSDCPAGYWKDGSHEA